MNNTPIIQCYDTIASISGFNFDGRPLNLEAYAGEMINVIGPDYSGKSAWTRMLCGKDRCASGNVSIFNKSLFSYKRSDWINLRKNVAFIETDTALLSAANGLQNVMMPANYHHIDTPPNILIRAKQLLSEITPDSNPAVLPAQLRKDQRYKIAIARALILQPQVIVLDSPFELLDHATAKRLKKFLLKYSAENNTLIVVVSHDIQFALKHSDKIIFVSSHEISVFDSENEILSCGNPDIDDFLKHE